MKKIINLIVAFGTLLTVSSCDLDLEPTSGPTSEGLLNIEQLRGLRLGLYGNIKAVSSGSYLYNPDWFTDLTNETINAGGTGYYFHIWALYSSDGDVANMWANYNAMIRNANYFIMKAKEAIASNDALKVELDPFIGEAHFMRAYALNKLALLFCEDYDPGKDSQMGVPVQTEYSKDPVNLSRGKLSDVYGQILSDIAEAKLGINRPGELNAIYLTKDAITAFEAQIALQMHDYDNAIKCANMLQPDSKLPNASTIYSLVTTSEHLEQMWREDKSTETIFQPEVSRATLGSVNSMAYYYYAIWTSTGFIAQPYYVPEQHYVNLFANNDIRTGIYIEKMPINIMNVQANGYVISKFTGNETFQTDREHLSYRNMPKVFRLAQMYLIEAEARYRNNEAADDVLIPLNKLRTARGLTALTPNDVVGNAKDDAGNDIPKLFRVIQEEYMREMIAEGGRLFDLKRWGQGFKRDYQTALGNILSGRGVNLQVNANSVQFVWPIPNDEISNNPNFGSQNPGYAQ